MPRPAPESIITSPSAMHSEDISADIFVLMDPVPGSKGNLILLMISASAVNVGDVRECSEAVAWSAQVLKIRRW